MATARFGSAPWAPSAHYSEVISFTIQGVRHAPNVGTIDRIIRIVAGLALIAWARMGGPVWASIGMLPLATGLVKICPTYSLLGINTCGLKK